MSLQRYHSPSSSKKKRKSMEGAGEDWVRAFSEHHLKHRIFQRWRDRTSLLNPSPVTSGVMTYAVFKWISMVYDPEKLKNPFAVLTQPPPPSYVFPFYAFKESDGTIAEYSISRLRSYVIDKIQIPTGRIPLLLHALGLLDAFQLQRMFYAWKQIVLINRYLDTRFQKKRTLQLLKRWYRWSMRKDHLRYGYQVLSKYQQRKDLRGVFYLWKTHYKVQYFHRYIGPRFLNHRVFKSFYHHRIVSSMIRQSHETANVFSRRKLLYTSFFTLLSQLCKVAKVKSLLSKHIEYLLQQENKSKGISINTDAKYSLLQSSSLFPSTSTIKVPPSDIRNWILSLLHSQLPSDADLEDDVIVVDTSDGSGGIISMQHTRKSFWKNGIKTWMRVIKLIQQRRWSRISQSFLTTVGGSYRFYRQQWRCLHHWMQWTRSRTSRNRTSKLRSPHKVKPDTRLPGSPSFAASRHTILARLRRGLGMNDDEDGLVSREEWWKSLPFEEQHQYQGMMKFGLMKWKAFSQTRSSLKKRYLILHYKDNVRCASKALGAWLMITARFQVINRAANRLWNNTIQRQLWQAWFAWRNQYERAVLIRNNRREIIALRNAEMKEFELLQQPFTDMGDEGAEYGSQMFGMNNPMRKWSLFVRDRSRGKRVLSTWLRFGGRNTIIFYWIRWKALLEWDALVNVIKRRWYGYKVRKLKRYDLYRYLQWYRHVAVPRLLGFQRYLAYKHIFTIFQLHHEQLKNKAITFSLSNRLRFAWMKLRRRCQRNMLYHRRSHRHALIYYNRLQCSFVLKTMRLKALHRVTRRQRLLLRQEQKISEAFHRAFVMNRYYQLRFHRACRIDRRKKLRQGWLKLLITNSKHRKKRLVERSQEKANYYLLYKYLIQRWCRTFYQPRRYRRRVIYQRQYLEKAVDSFRHWQRIASIRAKVKRSYEIDAKKQYQHYRLRKALQILYLYRSNWSFICRHDRRFNAAKAQQAIQQEEEELRQRVGHGGSSALVMGRSLMRKSLSTVTPGSIPSSVRFRRGSDDVLFQSLLIQHPPSPASDSSSSDRQGFVVKRGTTGPPVTGYHFRRRQQRQLQFTQECNDRQLFLFVSSRQYACILLKRTLNRFQGYVAYRRSYREFIHRKLVGHDRKKLKAGFRAIFVNWRQALLRARDGSAGGLGSIGSGGGSLLSARYRRRMAAALGGGGKRGEGSSSESSAALLGVGIGGGIGSSLSTQQFLRKARLRRMTSQQRDELSQLDDEARRGELYITWAQRKHREILRQQIKRRITKQSQLSDIDELLSSAYYYFQHWYIKSQQYFRHYRHVTKKRYLFMVYIMKKNFAKWLYWSRYISGKYHHRCMKKSIMFHTKHVYRQFFMKLQSRYRRHKKCFFVLTTRLPKQQVRLSLKQFLYRWIKYWQKKARRKRSKELYRRFNQGYYGFTTEHSLKVIGKLRKRMKHFLEQLKLLKQYRLEKERLMLPYRLRPYVLLQEKEKNFMKLRFQKFVTLLQRRRCRRLIANIVVHSSIQTRIRRCVRYWKKWLVMRKIMRRINRRFYLKHSLRHWCEILADTLKEKQICRIMNKRTSKRMKRDIFNNWKVFTIQEGKLRAMFDIVRLRALKWMKHRSLYAWTVVLDNRLLRQRAEYLQERQCQRLRKQAFATWYKQMIVSELYTWQNTKICWSTWKNRLYWMMKQRTGQTQALTFHHSYTCHQAIRLWQYFHRKSNFFQRLKKSAKRQFRRYSQYRALVRWQRRVLIRRVERLEDIRLRQPQRLNPLTYPTYRALSGWLRYTRVRIYHRHKRTMQHVMTTWKASIGHHKVRRQIFLNRLEIFRQRQLQRLVWRNLYSIWHSKKIVSKVTSSHEQRVLTQGFHIWLRMFSKTIQAKRNIHRLIQTIYQHQVYRFFITWKCKTRCSYRIGCSRIQQFALYRWHNIYKAKRYHRLLSLCMMFTSWKSLIRKRESAKSLYLQRNKRIRMIVMKHIKRDRSLMTMAFHKWRLGDFSMKFSQFCSKYQEIERERKQAEAFGDDDRLQQMVPIAKIQMHNRLLTEMATSQAGSMLLFHAHLEREQQPWTKDEINFWKTRSPERTIPRSLEVQSHFLEYCEEELDKRDLVWKRSQQLKNRLRRRSSHNNSIVQRASAEEKMQSESVPLREKMSILASPVGRPAMGKYIGLRTGLHTQGFAYDENVEDVMSIRSRANSPSKQHAEGRDSRWGTFSSFGETQRREIHPQDALLQELM